MDDIASILEALKGLSPFLAIVGLLLIGWIVWLRHVETKTEAANQRATDEELAKQLQDLNSAMSQLDNKSVALQAATENIARESARMLAVVESCDARADHRFSRQVDVLGQIHEQLVRLNAAHATVITPDNAKRIIQYQWSWAEEETSRLVINSIRNNSFRGREDIVARKVYESWRKAAENSLTSLTQLEGLQYPYRHLYSDHLALIWRLIWAWAVPVYHSVHTDDGFEARLADLASRVHSLFDQVLVLHYELVEDIDHGLFYSEDRSPKTVTVARDLRAPHEMGAKLRDFRHGDTDRITTPGDLREALARAIQADESERRELSTRTKSSAEIPIAR